MAKRKKTVVTASSMACLFTCARKYYLSYVLGWRKRKAEDALRFGTAFHKGLEVWFDLRKNAQARDEKAQVADEKAQGMDGEGGGTASVLQQVDKVADEADCAMKAVEAAIGTAGEDAFDAETAEQITALLLGYFCKWKDERFTVEPEREFAVTFKFLPGVVVCGKMDGVVTLADGKKALIEHKTTSEDVGPMSDYWTTINRDQVGLYKAAGEKEGIEFASVIYDVIRKPTIKCGKDETAEQYGARLRNDCNGAQEGDNPRAKGYKRGSDFYFARRELPMLDCDMDVLARRLYAAKAMIATYRRLAKRFAEEGAAEIEAWPKCGSAMACRMCTFRGVCGTAELPETEWEKGRMYEELEVAKKWLA